MRVDPANVENLVTWPWREFESFSPISPRTIRAESGETLIPVCSTQYLGLLWNPHAAAAIREIVDRTPAMLWGSLGSNFLGGTHEARLALETSVALRVGCETGLAFASGWAANYAVCEAVGKLCDLVISDVRNHNSVIHGLRAS